MAFEVLATGYGLVEGPRVDEAGNLYFSDVTKGGVYRRSPDGEVTTIVPKRRGVGGISLHAEGGLVISGRNLVHVKEGLTRVLHEDPEVGGFNDIFTDSQGRVYFGSLRSNPFAEEGPRIPGELYRLDLEGRCVKLYGDVALTNGIGFSPDGRFLYHADSAVRRIWRHEMVGDGARDRRVIVEVDAGAPDGLAVDREGFVWVAIYGGGCVQRFAPDGTLERSLPVPATAVTSVCFGGVGLRDLYVVTADNVESPEVGGTIFRTCVEVGGLPVPLARV